MSLIAKVNGMRGHARQSLPMTIRASLGLVIVTSTIVVSGCGQSFGEGLRVLCESPKYCCGHMEVGSADWSMRLAQRIDERVKNQNVRQFFMDLADLPFSEKSDVLRIAATYVGIAPADCPLLPYWVDWGKGIRPAGMRETKAGEPSPPPTEDHRKRLPAKQR